MISSELPRILILDTGGTISQTAGADGSLVPCSTEYIEMVPRLHEIARLEVLRLERMDSSDMTAALRMEMARLIYENYDNYEGFVVIHGTDTMVDTAAALSYMLQDLGKPVVLTGAQLPIFAPGPDGLNNLFYSVQTASMDLGEVVICFGDRILRGNRSLKENVHGFNAFHSFRVPALGELGVTVQLLDHRIHRRESSPSLYPHLDSSVLYVTLTSGTTVSILESLLGAADLRGLVLGCFGSGNLPAHELPALKKILARGVPVLVITTCLKGNTILSLYASGRKVYNAGAREGLDLTPSAAVQKMMYALGRIENEKPGLQGPARQQALYDLLTASVSMDMDESLRVSE
ncbi:MULTISPECIES: asparaginase [unclassified Oceanispirochaeta]|uniref:asparaginase n=1 Tax=unclassified Oceanispirochaeta TaxID=2635722 RepID=UPI001314C9ED|nr:MULTISPECIES: asparaginase [unclassified Oceanispirochaeta]MBF9014944.1 asparaginase [Oceanispirochaeta sp. M2]NPD71375.1 asparaginase [Oceanispirochaeta sp. M1]